MCNTTAFGDRNHVKFHLHLPWIQLSHLPLYHHEKGQTSPRWEPKGCHKAALKYFCSPLWALRGGGSQMFLVRLVQFIQLHSFCARSLSSTPGVPYSVLLDPAVNAAPSAAAFGLIDPFCSRLELKERLVQAGMLKGRSGLQWTLSLAKPLSPSLTFLHFILKYSDLTIN